MKRSPIKRRKPLARGSELKRKTPIKRSPMRKGKRKTAHARRPREWGFMAFARDRGCELNMDRDTQRIFGFVHVCDGPREFAHLSDRKRYDVGDIGAGLCRGAHRGFDGKVGGKAPWYAALSRDGQRMVRERLANLARRAWNLLTDAERAEWERKAAAWLASQKGQRT